MIKERATEECKSIGEAYDEGYEQGKADAIEEILTKVKELKLQESCPDGCVCVSEQECCPYNECNNDVIRLLEQLKEKKDE